MESFHLLVGRQRAGPAASESHREAIGRYPQSSRPAGDCASVTVQMLVASRMNLAAAHTATAGSAVPISSICTWSTLETLWAWRKLLLAGRRLRAFAHHKGIVGVAPAIEGAAGVPELGEHVAALGVDRISNAFPARHLLVAV